MSFKQANWNEPVVFELGAKGRRGHLLPLVEKRVRDKTKSLEALLPPTMKRRTLPMLPELSEPEAVRHFIRLSQMNYGIDCGLYPLGSCTMKYNPKVNDEISSSPNLKMLHPYQDEKTTQGILSMLYNLERWLAELTGTFEVCLQPSAGAHGELLGTLLMRQFHKHNNQAEKRTEIIIPDSAHGTNPASATMAGFSAVIIPSGKDGCVDLKALRSAISQRTAGLMLTNPNTLGIFEKNIEEIAEVIHEAGGLFYCDGANMNPLLCKTRPGDMGFDIVHINIHKTFSTPHGGGGPGAGPVGVSENLAKFLPIPGITMKEGLYHLDYDKPNSIGKIRGFYGNIAVLVRAYAYILSMGAEGLKEAAEISVLNANYLMKKLQEIKGLSLPFADDNPRKHECVLSVGRLKADTGVGALNLSKRLLDYGLHAPTIYFPQIVDEALMIEPTETFDKKELDRFVEAVRKVSEEAYTNPQIVMSAPLNTSIYKLDEVKASHPKSLALSWRMYRKRIQCSLDC